MMHRKQLSFFAAFSFTRKAFPSTVLPFSSCFPLWLVPSFMCYWMSGTGSCTSNLSISALSPFLSLLACIDIKWDLPGAWIKLCWIQIEVVKWPYYPLKPGPALEIRVQELVACPVYNLYWIHNSSYKIKVNNTVGKPEQFKALFSPLYTHIRFFSFYSVQLWHITSSMLLAIYLHLGAQPFPYPWPVLPCVLWPYRVSRAHASRALMGKVLLEEDCPWMRGRD